MDVAFGSVSTDLQALSPDNRSFCEPVQSSATPVCVPALLSSGSMDRRILPAMVRRKAVLISAPRTDPADFTKAAVRRRARNTSGASLAGPSVLSAVNENGEGTLGSSCQPGHSGLPDNRSVPSHLGSSSLNGVANLSLVNHIPSDLNIGLKGLSETAVSNIINARRPSTVKQYESAQKIWQKWCVENDCNYLDTTVQNVLNFLSQLFYDGKSVSTIGLYRSAISACHKLVNGLPIGQASLICSLMQGMKNNRPSVPRYATTWQVDKVCTVLAGKDFSPNDSVNIFRLMQKVAMLIVLSTACRLSVLVRLDLATSLVKREDHYILQPSGLDKVHSGLYGSKPLYIWVNEFKPLCPVQALDAFLVRTKDHRKSHKSLFFSYLRDDQAVTVQELRSWFVKLMGYAGVPNNFKSHSTRGAAVSKAVGFLGMKSIMAAADWSRQDTLKRFYLRNVSSDESQKLKSKRDFQTAVLSV